MNAQQDNYGNYKPIQTPMLAGNTATSNAGGVIVGQGNPNGVAVALPGSLYYDYLNQIFYGTANGTVWLNQNTGGGGGGTAQFVLYTSGQPAAPPNPALGAQAYDPNGILPTLYWNPSNLTWN